MQLSFLSNICKEPRIEGLVYIPAYITQELEAKLIGIIDSQPWNLELKRRTQHYGYKYDYIAKEISPSLYLGSLPDWLQKLSHKLHASRLFSETPDQVIVNEYSPGQGIAPHIDCSHCFGDTIASLSLNSSCLIDFSKNNESTSVLLEPRSLVIISGEVRYYWKHGIAARKSDLYQETRIQRQRRLSLTFRKVVL